MLVHADGRIVGTIGGGCLEAEMTWRAREAIEGRRPRLVSYDLTPDQAGEDGLVCGGRMQVFIEPIEGTPVLCLFGAGHVAQPLARMAKACGFRVELADDRVKFANAERFPDADLIVLDDFPASYITSFNLKPEQAGVVNELVAAFPNLTVIDVAGVLRQVSTVIEQLAGAVQFVFLFALLAGAAVLFAALEATHDERQYELAVMRTLGARNRQLRSALLAEFAVLGATAGLLGGLGASAIGYALAHFVFRLPLEPNLTVPLVGLVGGIAGVMLAGYLGTFRALRIPALQSLRALG